MPNGNSVVLIGRPNVGKSTLFNRLAGGRLAIVGDMPGITRDRKSAMVSLCGLEFELLDAPGVDPLSRDALAISMNAQSLAGVRESVVVFFMVDAREGITLLDREIASWLRSSFGKVGNRPVILIENKSEGNFSPVNASVLGFGEGIAISAEHNLGMDGIYEALVKCDALNVGEKCEVTQENAVKIAVIGRPNVGKSTLINAILEDDRLLTGEQAGITRDAISVDCKFKNRRITLIDTAGQRRKSQIKAKIEAISVMDARRYIRQAHVAWVLTDIENPLEKQDITVAREAFEEGKIVIFILSKSDKSSNPDEVQKSVERRLQKEFAQLPGVLCLLISAKEKKGLARVFNVSLKLFDNWSRRIPTGVLNRWLQTAVSQTPPPLVHNLPIKLKYISQTSSKPPTFVIFANRSDHLPDSYGRYLLNHLSKSFEFGGVPLRLSFRQRKNPFGNCS
ncbi:MAG: ribosome biogenesis GTPase Der [Holosporaceae bacterium]|jgi:GTP-binding protein|nr:ribosome biogenesis GTPase Der [Holosporaceae bacterium]